MLLLHSRSIQGSLPRYFFTHSLSFGYIRQFFMLILKMILFFSNSAAVHGRLDFSMWYFYREICLQRNAAWWKRRRHLLPVLAGELLKYRPVFPAKSQLSSIITQSLQAGWGFEIQTLWPSVPSLVVATSEDRKQLKIFPGNNIVVQVGFLSDRQLLQ